MKKNIKSTVLHTLAFLPLAAFCLHGQAHAETGSTGGKYEGQSLCEAGNEIYLSCPTKSGKILSVCSTTKQKPNIMYLAYGTPKKIEVSSPRTGEFPLKHSYLTPAGYSFYFSENGKQFIAYDVAAIRGPFEQAGFVTRKDSNHDILAHDMCRTKPIVLDTPNSDDYIQREEKSPGHSDSIRHYDDNDDTRLFELMHKTQKGSFIEKTGF